MLLVIHCRASGSSSETVEFCFSRQITDITFNVGKPGFPFVRVGSCFSFGEVVFVPNFMKSLRCLPSSSTLVGF